MQGRLKEVGALLVVAAVSSAGALLALSTWSDLRAQWRVLAEGVEADARVTSFARGARSKLYLDLEWQLPNGSKRRFAEVRTTSIATNAEGPVVRIKYLPAAAAVRPVLVGREDTQLWFDLLFYAFMAGLGPPVLIYYLARRLRSRESH